MASGQFAGDAVPGDVDVAFGVAQGGVAQQFGQHVGGHAGLVAVAGASVAEAMGGDGEPFVVDAGGLGSSPDNFPEVVSGAGKDALVGRAGSGVTQKLTQGIAVDQGVAVLIALTPSDEDFGFVWIDVPRGEREQFAGPHSGGVCQANHQAFVVLFHPIDEGQNLVHGQVGLGQAGTGAQGVSALVDGPAIRHGNGDVHLGGAEILVAHELAEHAQVHAALQASHRVAVAKHSRGQVAAATIETFPKGGSTEAGRKGGPGQGLVKPGQSLGITGQSASASQIGTLLVDGQLLALFPTDAGR